MARKKKPKTKKKTNIAKNNEVKKDAKAAERVPEADQAGGKAEAEDAPEADAQPEAKDAPEVDQKKKEGSGAPEIGKPPEGGPCSCCCEAPTAAADEEDDVGGRELTSAQRAEYLFNTSSFVMTVVSIFLVFGAFIQARPFRVIVYAHNAFLNKALLLGILVLEVGILMKLYAVLLRLREEPMAGRAPDTRADWFLKVGTITFVVTATFRLVVGIIQSRQIASLARVSKRLSALYMWSDGLITQSLAMACFFLLLAIFSLVYHLYTKYARLAQA